MMYASAFTNNDDINTLGFGDLGACTPGCTSGRIYPRVVGTTLLEWDIVLNSNLTWQVTGGSLQGRMDIRNVLTHEVGHVVGIDHSSMGAVNCGSHLYNVHWYLTMHGCSAFEETLRRTLGLGDMLGLADKLN